MVGSQHRDKDSPESQSWQEGEGTTTGSIILFSDNLELFTHEEVLNLWGGDGSIRKVWASLHGVHWQKFLSCSTAHDDLLSHEF